MKPILSTNPWICLLSGQLSWTWLMLCQMEVDGDVKERLQTGSADSLGGHVCLQFFSYLTIVQEIGVVWAALYSSCVQDSYMWLPSEVAATSGNSSETAVAFPPCIRFDMDVGKLRHQERLRVRMLWSGPPVGCCFRTKSLEVCTTTWVVSFSLPS